MFTFDGNLSPNRLSKIDDRDDESDDIERKKEKRKRKKATNARQLLVINLQIDGQMNIACRIICHTI